MLKYTKNAPDFLVFGEETHIPTVSRVKKRLVKTREKTYHLNHNNLLSDVAKLELNKIVSCESNKINKGSHKEHKSNTNEYALSCIYLDKT